ncbi:MAG: hypothetical protein AB1414_20330 [bacterium]
MEVKHGLRCSLTIGKIYEVVSIENGGDYYRIIDDTGEDYLFPAYMFEEAERSQTTSRVGDRGRILNCGRGRKESDYQ